MDKYLVADFVYKLKENAIETRSQKGDLFASGQNLAFYAMAMWLKNIISIHYLDELADYGLDFDLEKELL